MGAGCPRIDMRGKRVGRLVVREPGSRIRARNAAWLCDCDCGGQVVVEGIALRQALKRGAEKSCKGCRHIGTVRKHGLARSGARPTSEYAIWVGMRQRCTNPNSFGWRWYGALGVKVSERWDDFATFLADMGPRPSPEHSIDRYPDPAGHYQPGNCRWATRKEQAANKRANARRT